MQVLAAPVSRLARLAARAAVATGQLRSATAVSGVSTAGFPAASARGRASVFTSQLAGDAAFTATLFAAALELIVGGWSVSAGSSTVSRATLGSGAFAAASYLFSVAVVARLVLA